MTGANRFGATGLSGLGAFRGCPVVVSSGCSEADLCLLFRTFRVHPPLPLGSADLFKELSERHLSRRDVRRRALFGRGFTGPARSAPQAAALSFSNAELFRRLRSRSPDAACCKICSATSSVVTDFRTKKRRSVTTSFSACRMTATVDASYFCLRSFIVAVPIVAGCLLEFLCKRMMN
jgi:hypothetical protein